MRLALDFKILSCREQIVLGTVLEPDTYRSKDTEGKPDSQSNFWLLPCLIAVGWNSLSPTTAFGRKRPVATAGREALYPPASQP